MQEDMVSCSDLEKEIAKLMIRKKIASINIAQPYTFDSGIKSPIYCDNRIFISYPIERKIILNGFFEIINEKEFDAVAGVALAGIPWASWIATQYDKPMLYVREKAKDHGKKNIIEGKIEKGQKIIVVEDLISTAKSCITAAEALRNEGGTVDDVVGIFQYGFVEAEKNLSKARLKLKTLTNFSELIHVAIEDKYILPEQKYLVLEWKNDPENWYKKHYCTIYKNLHFI